MDFTTEAAGAQDVSVAFRAFGIPLVPPILTEGVDVLQLVDNAAALTRAGLVFNLTSLDLQNQEVFSGSLRLRMQSFGEPVVVNVSVVPEVSPALYSSSALPGQRNEVLVGSTGSITPPQDPNFATVEIALPGIVPYVVPQAGNGLLALTLSMASQSVSSDVVARISAGEHTSEAAPTHSLVQPKRQRFLLHPGFDGIVEATEDARRRRKIA